jgi:hypothetical protein
MRLKIDGPSGSGWIASISPACAIQHLLEDQADGLLHAPIGVPLIAVAGFHEAYRGALARWAYTNYTSE